MRKYDLLIGLALLLATPLCAQGWLPKQPTVNPPCRLLECTYDKAQLNIVKTRVQTGRLISR